MNLKTWRYYAVVCMAVCLVLLCGTIVRDAGETVAVQEDGTGVSAVNDEVSVMRAETQAVKEVPVRDRETSTEGNKLHTEDSAETSDAVFLPTGKVVHGFGWQEEDGAWRYHCGVDIAYTQGEQVRIVKGGTVHRVERIAGGYAVEVKRGEDVWRYEPLAHVSAIVGKRVEAGAVLGSVGEDGHLHIGRQHKGVWAEPISMQN